MTTLKTSFIFFRRLIAKPSKAFEYALESRSAISAVPVYLFYLAASAVFYSLKPADFPAEAAQLKLGSVSAVSWFANAAVWETFFLVLLVFSLSLFSGLAQRLKTAFFIPVSLALLAAPAAAKIAGISAALPVIYVIAWYFFRFPGFRYAPAAAIAILSTALAVLAIPPEALTAAFRWETGYMAVQLVFAVWSLLLMGGAVKFFCKLGTAKTAIALIFSLALSFILIMAAHLSGLISSRALSLLFLT